ncbi:hypothetical protein HOA91_04730 [Candidatus Woesearchaeota archaeon]|jgi:hypothetical protein|nr:hypothetical protein [Candidatus Woesearchaeota archaeon]
MKKSNKPRKSTKNDNIKPKIIVSVVILAIIILVGVLFQFTNIGQAVFRVDTPSDTIKDVNMAAYEAIEINVETIETLNFKMKTTSSDVNKEFVIKLEINEEGVLNYLLTEEDSILAMGLLGEIVPSSGDLYLDDDELPDTQLSFADGYLKILNANYAEPDASEITVIDGKTGIAYLEDVKIISAVKEKPLNLIFNVTSTVTPVVTASWEDGTNLGEEQLVEIDSGDTYVTLNFTWTSTEDTAYLLTFEAITGDKITTITYILSAGKIVYILEETNYPKIKVKEMETGYQTTLTFSGNEMLPFSIPCGELELDAHTSEQISTIYSYDQSIQQWKDNVPSEINKLISGKGYFLDLKEGETSLALTIDCSLDAGTLPPKDYDSFTTLPTLVEGWNLVGIGGFTVVSEKEMLPVVPANKEIIAAFVIANDGVSFEEVTEFEPGKAYWIKIG